MDVTTEKDQQVRNWQRQKLKYPQRIAIAAPDGNQASDRECEKHDSEDTAGW
ncbi:MULTISPECIES: hypothetical protein [unclassified Dyella]|uniref:hypothetical protein n=1 Tax=unclassified Dyella TaxID=2634549 RepID=UPI003F8F7142